MSKHTLILSTLLAASLAGCATTSQNQYTEGDIGRQIKVDFGQIITEREVKIQGTSTGLGATGGGIAGAAAGSAFGQGSGQAVGILGGLVIGAIAGAIAEHELQNRTGIEYTITKRNGDTITIVQNIAKDDVPLKPGQRVIIQTAADPKHPNANYVRVLPAQDLPTEIQKPKNIKVIGD